MERDYSSCKVRVTCMNPGCTEQIEMTVRAEDTGYTHETLRRDLHRSRIRPLSGAHHADGGRGRAPVRKKRSSYRARKRLGICLSRGYPTCLREGCSGRIRPSAGAGRGRRSAEKKADADPELKKEIME